MDYESIGSSPVDWAGKPYPEIQDLAARDGSILVVPIGSLEQHGPHLPTITDTLLVDAVAHAGAEPAAADGVPVLVTPPIWTGNSAHHLPFGGTASIEPATLQSILKEISDSTLGNGFDTILFINGHGGNVSSLGVAVNDIGRDHPETEVIGITYFELAADFIDDIRESDHGGMGHAGEFETSLMLHIRPKLVQSDLTEGTRYAKPYSYEGGDMFTNSPLTVYRPFSAYSEQGAAGKPELATAEKGAAILDGLGDALCDLLSEIHGATP